MTDGFLFGLPVLDVDWKQDRMGDLPQPVVYIELGCMRSRLFRMGHWSGLCPSPFHSRYASGLASQNFRIWSRGVHLCSELRSACRKRHTGLRNDATRFHQRRADASIHRGISRLSIQHFRRLITGGIKYINAQIRG